MKCNQFYFYITIFDVKTRPYSKIFFVLLFLQRYMDLQLIAFVHLGFSRKITMGRPLVSPLFELPVDFQSYSDHVPRGAYRDFTVTPRVTLSLSHPSFIPCHLSGCGLRGRKTLNKCPDMW